MESIYIIFKFKYNIYFMRWYIFASNQLNCVKTNEKYLKNYLYLNKL